MIRIILKFEQFVKYCVAGGIATLIDFFLLYLLVEYAQVPVVPGAMLSFLVAVIFSYIINSSWTFKIFSNKHSERFVKFLIVASVGFVLTVGLMYLQVEVFFVWYLAAKAITSFIVLVWNFLVNKFWTFKIRHCQFP